MPRGQKPNAIYQLRIDLKGIRPPIWRRLLVPADIKLSILSEIFLLTMGWEGYHLHQFEIDGVYYGEPHPDYFDEMRDESKVRLRDVVSGAGSRFTYEYDFGDSWEHIVKVEKVLEAEEGVRYPICTAGKRACPPEDVGGPWGYEAFLEAIQNPDHAEHEEMLEWVGEDFDPEAFDPEEINEQLRG